jgi:hypothetical protein
MKSSWSHHSSGTGKNDEFLFQRQDDQQQQQLQQQQFELFSPFIQPFEGHLDQVNKS